MGKRKAAPECAAESDADILDRIVQEIRNWREGFKTYPDVTRDTESDTALRLQFHETNRFAYAEIETARRNGTLDRLVDDGLITDRRRRKIEEVCGYFGHNFMSVRNGPATAESNAFFDALDEAIGDDRGIGNAVVKRPKNGLAKPCKKCGSRDTYIAKTVPMKDGRVTRHNKCRGCGHIEHYLGSQQS